MNDSYSIPRIHTEEPILFSNKENCCGCAACYSICPAGAIEMTEDREGFLYPHVNRERCIKCYKCLDVCAFKEDQIMKGYYTKDSEVVTEI